MECTIVVGTKEGKTYNVEAKDEQARIFLGKKIGDTISVTPLGLKGYEVSITGGSDKSGFPMRKDIHLTGRAKALLSSRGTGYKPPGSGVRERKTLMGNVVTEEIVQINTKVVKAGKDPVEKLIGKAEATGEEKEEATEKPPEKKEKPAEKKEEKPAEEKKQEKPVEEKPAGKKEEAKEEKPAEEPKEEKSAEEKPEKAEEESVSEEPKDKKE